MGAASAATAAVNNLESYHFRHDYSTGARVFMGGANCLADFISNKDGVGSVAVAGPNGSGSAMHVGECWGALKINDTEVAEAYLDENAWTFAMSFKPGCVEKGILFAIGRLNGGKSSGRLDIIICSSSDPSKLYIQEFYRASSATVPALGNSAELTGLGNMTNGFHTLVLAYDPSAKTITPYVDGAKKTVLTLSSKTNTNRKIGNGFQYGSHSSITELPSGYSRSYTNTDVAFYDVRFYLGAFDANDATAYAALYPCTYPFRPNAYVESGAVNTTANASVGNYVDTGYLAKGATTRFAADYQFLDVRGQQRIFGTRGTFVQGLYINGSAASGGKLAWNFMGTAKWVDTGSGAGRLRRIATFDRVGKTIAVTNYEDRAQFYCNGTQADLLKDTSDADHSTYLFAEYNNSAAGYGKARIYSFEADESGTPVHFFAPDIENGEAGFRDVVTGSFHGDGNKDNCPERPLRFYNGVGCASDYKYEDSTLYAKLYATSDDGGAVGVADGAAAATGEGWIPHGGTLALSATPPENMEFNKWTGDTWAIADGFSATDASIEVSTPYAVQLRATFKPSVNARLTVAADGAASVDWSVADWRNADDDSETISAPSDKEVTIVAHRSFTLDVDGSVALSKLTVTGDVNCVVTLSANVGSFVSDEVVVSGCVLKQGMADVLGATPKVTVEDGATFDPAKQTLPLTLNGFTLVKTGIGTLQIRRPYSTNEGTIDVQAGAVTVSGWTNADAAYGETSISNITLVVRAVASAVNAISYPLYFKNIDLRGGTLTSSSGAFGVYEALSGHGAAAKLAMAEGAVYRPDGLGFLSVSTTVPSTLNLDLGGIARSPVPLLSVPASLESVADAALASLPRGWKLKKESVTGENDAAFVTYKLLRKGLTIVVW